MWRKKWLVVSFGLTLVAAACTTSLGSTRLEGLELLTEQVGVSQNQSPGISPGPASGPLQSLADKAEELAPFLDVVQIGIDEDILRYYLGKMAHNNTMDVDVLAADTPGFTPADLKYLLNEALRRALFDGRDRMSYADFRTAMPEHSLGLRQPIPTMSKQDRLRVAYHEAGHAIAACVFQPDHRISRISIVRYGGALGHVDHKPTEEKHTLTREDILNRMCISLGGRAAEEEIFDVAMTGASNDLNNVRQLLRTMAQTGMLTELGVGEQPTPAMQQEMESIYREQLVRTRKALRANREALDRIVDRLLKREEIDYLEIEEIIAECGCNLPKVVEAEAEEIDEPVVAH